MARNRASVSEPVVADEGAKPIGVNELNTPQAQAINSIYDTQLEAQKANLEAAYNQNLSNAQASQEKIAGKYQTSANDLATQFERNRANFNEAALGAGINTGAGSQARLAMHSEYQRDFGNLRMKEAEAEAEAQRGIDNLKINYQNQVNQAISESDYRRATALLEEYNNNISRLQNQAQILAQAGDFSGYYKYFVAAGYPANEARSMVNNMQSYWAAANPDVALRMGKISQGTYDSWLNPGGGYEEGGSSGGGGYSGGGGSGGSNNSTTVKPISSIKTKKDYNSNAIVGADKLFGVAASVNSALKAGTSNKTDTTPTPINLDDHFKGTFFGG